VILFPLLALLAADARGGCADHWSVALDAKSFAQNGAGRTFSAAELDAFRSKIEAQLKSAIGDACASGAIEPASAKAVGGVEVSSASGASDPLLYQGTDRTLLLEWAFAEEELAVPTARELEAGAACWTDPDGESCNSHGD
jgi:hypothetical protein